MHSGECNITVSLFTLRGANNASRELMNIHNGTSTLFMQQQVTGDKRCLISYVTTVNQWEKSNEQPLLLEVKCSTITSINGITTTLIQPQCGKA